jgi:predicted DNA-binding transcriptional regulator AlpA
MAGRGLARLGMAWPGMARQGKKAGPLPATVAGLPLKDGAMAEPDKLIGTAELAERLGMPRKQVINRYRRMGIKAIKSGRRLFFRERDIAEWMTAHEKDQ